MTELGGFFELELNKSKEYHQNAIRLNSGRNSFEYILLAKKYKKVYLPYFTCEVMLEPINRLGLYCELYSVDETLRPVFDFSKILQNEVFVFTNYFGICDLQVEEIFTKCKNLIVDNSQAFFSKPLSSVDTFYSPRKFFGVPDGGYLYTDKFLDNNIEEDHSYTKMMHLLKRIDLGAEEGYGDFKKNEAELTNQPIMQMSKLTKAILNSINYKKNISLRQRNFMFLHKKLHSTNKLSIVPNHIKAPMVYPYLSNNPGLRNILIREKIYVAKYWENVLSLAGITNTEKKLIDNIVPLPVDQRVNIEDYSRVFQIMDNYAKS